MLNLAKLLLVCFLFCNWLLPVYAVPLSSPNSALEAQVLQIIRNHPEVILESVQAYEQQQYEQQKQQQQAAFRQMTNNSQVLIGNSPITDAAQKVVLIEFSDFQCPYCRKMSSNLKEFVSNHQGEVALVYKHLPLIQIHEQALPAAQVGWAAQQQGKFWQFHDQLFAQQNKLGEDLYLSIAKELDLNLEQFNRDRKSDAANKAIQKDVEIAQKLGIQGTPFLAIYDRSVQNSKVKVFSGAMPFSDLEDALKQVTQEQ
jgi:protein-disulfide isomerase